VSWLSSGISLYLVFIGALMMTAKPRSSAVGLSAVLQQVPSIHCMWLCGDVAHPAFGWGGLLGDAACGRFNIQAAAVLWFKRHR